MWHKFWFKEESIAPIAIFRILFGLFVLQVSLVELLPNFLRFFGVKGLIDSSTLSACWWQGLPIFDIFFLLPQKDIYRWAFFALFVITSIFLTIGFRTRLSAICVYLGLLTLDNQCPFVLDGGDDFMRILSFLLIFSPAGKAYSVDRFLQAKKEGISPTSLKPLTAMPWVQRMIQVQISLAYLHAFLDKIIGPQWQDGTAVYYASQLVDFTKFPIHCLTTQSPFYQILTYYTLFAEFAMATLVWFRPLRYWVLLAAIFLHLGIDLTMNLPCFEWLFISAYITFVDPVDLERLLSYCRNIFFSLSKKLVPTKYFAKQNQTKILEPIVPNSYSFVPLFLLLIFILIAGSIAAFPTRERFAVKEFRRNYQLRLAKTERLWSQQLDQIPANNNTEEQLIAQEALAIVLSLRKDYSQAITLLRNVCSRRVEQNTSYDPKLIRALSNLANLYLETGHLDACELCYQTIFNYENTRLPDNYVRASIDLNNLGVNYYFRSLLDTNKNIQITNLLKADTFFRQALNKLHNLKNQSGSQFNFSMADLLSNRYLVLRELGCFKEARNARREAAKLDYGRANQGLP